MYLLAILFINTVFLIFATYLLPQAPLLIATTGGGLVILIFLLLRRDNKQRHHMIKCLEDGLLCFNDGDFSASLTEKAPKQYQHLFKLFNQTGDKLRVERQHLYHREMLLDKVLSSSPVLTILVDHRQHIVFANRAALESFKPYGLMPGQDWLKLLDKLPEEFQSALTARGEAIFTVSDENNQQQAWHVAMSSVRMHQAQHQLYLLRTITEELSKQEVATWKKVISVISHELNNSLAPISTMCHNGTLLANNLDEPRLDRVFNSISRRINHLNEFIKGYASLTKLKLPQKTSLDWSELIEHLNSLFPFKLSAPLPEKPIIADGAQLEQVLINILKNAYEADKSHKVELSIKEIANKKVKIEITDQGIGMSEEVLQNALLPFYSTKHSGTGLGLALCREIVEAHQGKMIFSNIEQGGLSVSVILPMG